MTGLADHADAQCKRAVVLETLGRFEEAVACCDRALALRTDFPEALAHRAHALRKLFRLEEAVRDCIRSLELMPDSIPPLCTLAETLELMGQQSHARRCMQRILELDSNRADIRAMLVMSTIPKIPLSEGEARSSRLEFEDALHTFEQWLELRPEIDGEAVVGAATPFYIAYQSDCNNRELLAQHGKLCGRLMSRRVYGGARAASARVRSPGRVRVGIVSAQVRDHSVYHALVKGWIGRMDRTRIELGIVHLGRDQDDETQWARAHADFFIEGTRSLADWISTIGQLAPDVLIYPEIGMDALTLRLASMRLAAHQLAAWGHPETTGLPAIDCYVSAQRFEPPEASECYTERLIALPGLGCYYEPYGTEPVEVDLKRSGFSDDQALVLCPGMPFKYAPQHDYVYAEIARRVGKCRLVFFHSPVARQSDRFRQRLFETFRAASLVPDEHVVFAPWLEPAVFFGLMRKADVVLDTIGFSGFNTTMQAVECGVPIVAFEGPFMRGRFASGIMQHAGLPELVAHSAEEFIGLATHLISEQPYRAEIRERMRAGATQLYRDQGAVDALANAILSLQ